MDETPETDRIEHDLARTRARMDRRLDELQDHLTPRQLINDAFAYVRGGEGADFTSDLVRRARANPIAVALAGIGIAWLMASDAPPASRGGGPAGALRLRRDDLPERLRLAESRVARFDHDDDASYAGRLDEARGQVLGLARSASETAAAYAARIREAIASGAHDVAGQARALASQAGRDGPASGHRTPVQEGSTTMPGSTRDTLASAVRSPFALGALAAVVGAVAGSLIPTSDQEEEALGGVATRLRTAGRDLAQDVVDRGGRIASDTLAAVKDSADAHGLSADRPVGEMLAEVKSGDILGNVKLVAQESLQAGRDAAQTHLAGAPDAPHDGGRQG